MKGRAAFPAVLLFLCVFCVWGQEPAPWAAGESRPEDLTVELVTIGPGETVARAVAEIRGLQPAPELVLFAGDLAHDGNPRAFALGREILAGLPAPLAAVPGEGDGQGRDVDDWRRLFGEPRFSKAYDGFHLLGLHTSLMPSPQGPVFAVGREQRRWLARELERLDPDMPLIVLSHAPLGEIFRPWQQWTQDGPELLRLLSPFSRVYYFHGHVHREALSSQLSVFSHDFTERDRSLPTADRRPQTENHPLPATAWPLPSPLQGTPAAARPGLGPQGCGWGLVTLGERSVTYQSRMWAA